MSFTELVSSTISGVVASLIISVFIYWKDRRLWQKTKRFFVSKISGEVALARYYVLNVLDIEPTDESGEKPKPLDEIHEEILGLSINPKQFEVLYKYFKNIRQTVEKIRAQALAIPTFTPTDFHGIDEELKPLADYCFSYYFLTPLEELEDSGERKGAEQRLKERIVAVYQ